MVHYVTVACVFKKQPFRELTFNSDLKLKIKIILNASIHLKLDGSNRDFKYT